MYEPSSLVNNFLERILKLYIIIFSLSICIDFYILHSSLDISLQPMYREEDRTYVSRPFGITGQPSVNSVLLVFFYTFWLSLENKNVKSSPYLFLLVTLGVLLLVFFTSCLTTNSLEIPISLWNLSWKARLIASSNSLSFHYP